MLKSVKTAAMLALVAAFFGTSLQAAQAVEQPVKPASGAGKPAATGTKPGSTGAIKDKFIDLGPYMVEVHKKIKVNWHPPQNSKFVNVRWQIAPDGSISGLRIDRSSGDPASDKAAIDGVALSAPFAPLPKGLTGIPIEFGFGNEIRSGVHSVGIADRVASQSLYNEAVELINKKVYGDALDKLEFALDRDPENNQIAQALRYIGAYIDDETPDNIKLLHRILAIDPKQTTASEKLRILLKGSGKDAESATERLALGEECMSKRDAEGALAEFTIANALKAGTCPPPKMVQAYRVLAAHRMEKKWQTVAKFRKDVECLCGLGRAHQLAGEYDDAEKYYKDAVALDGGSDMAKSLLAKLETEKTSGEAADKIAAPVMAQHSSRNSGDLVSRANILNNEASELMKAKKYDEAIAKLREALSVDPACKIAKENLAASYNNLAITLSHKDAIPYFRKSLFLVPTENLTRKNLMSSLRSVGQKPDSFDERAKAADALASAGDYTGAVVEAREALALKKDGALEAKLKDYLKKAPDCP